MGIDDWWIDKLNDIFNDMGDFSGGYYSNRGNSNSEENLYNYSDRGIDIQIDDNRIYITVEMKVRENDIKVKPQETNLIVEYLKDGSWIRKNIILPRKVKPKTAKISYLDVTGILDVTLEIDEDV